MNPIDSYIDIHLIDEYAHKDFRQGYSLDVDELTDHERSNFLDRLMENDTAVRDFVLSQMQKLIDARLQECEAKDRDRSGLKLVQLSNGHHLLMRGAA